MFTQARSHSVVYHVRSPLVIPQLSGSTQEFIKGKTRQLYSVKKILCEFRPPNVSLCGQSFSNLSAFSQHSKVIQERNLTSFLIKVVFYYFRQFNIQKNSEQGRHLSIVHCVIILQGFLWTWYSLKSSYRRQTFQVSFLKHVFNYKK